MVAPDLFIKALLKSGIDFFAGVPDSLLKNVCAYITDCVPADRNLITANEGNAIGVATGHYLATGNPALVYMQNSGIGNAVNPLMSLADEKVYSIPMLLLIGWRGEPGVHDEPQHLKQGEVTLPLLETMGIPYIVLPDEDEAACEAAETMAARCRETGKPHAIVVRKGTFGDYKLRTKVKNSNPVSREDAMKCVVSALPKEAIIVSTTGKLSRELYEYRDARGEGHASDFLTVGSMGHSSSIALGIALAKPERRVVCFDGDGAFIMHLGAISNIGHLAPANLIHFIFNNGAHESVGGQPTLGYAVDIPAIARACGYRSAITVESIEGIQKAVADALATDGPTLIEIKAGINSRADLGRPKTSPIQNKEALMEFIRKG